MGTPEFVLELRRHIGHAPLWLSGATAVITRTVDGVEEVLLVQAVEQGAWTPVMGIAEPGEHPADTIVREAQEEVGLTIRPTRLAGVDVTPPVTHRNGDRAQYLNVTFRAEILDGTLDVDNTEVTAAQWFAHEDLPQLAPHHRERIEQALSPSEAASFETRTAST